LTKALSVEILEMAEEKGIAERTLCRAKSKLGIICIKHNGKWYWEWPIDIEVIFPEHHEDCQNYNVTPIENSKLPPYQGCVAI